MDLAVILVVVALVVVGVGAYVMLAARRESSHEAGRVATNEPISVIKFKPSMPAPPANSAASASVSLSKPTAVTAPAAGPLFNVDLEPITLPVVEIRWCRGFDPRSGVLDETARLRLIGDLGVVGKEWCVPLLCQAYEEERRPGHRQAALTSLAACRSRTATATFRLALASSDVAERAIAADALADLEPPPPQPKSRRTVERR